MSSKPDSLFRTSRRIEFADTDMAGIVHFANFFRFMEAAEVAFLRARGLSVAIPWEGQQLGFPRVAASCDYVKPARFEDLLDIAVSIERVGVKSVTYEFAFSRGGEIIHELGTVRMGNDPKTSALNKYCQAHEVKNLFVADAAPFVSNPDKNPTLTINAMSWRTSEYLAEEMRKGNV